MTGDAAASPGAPCGADKAEQELTAGERLKQLFLGRVKEWNEWRRERPDEVVTVNGIDLSGQNLEGIDFHGVRFPGHTSFFRACIRGANFQDAVFGGGGTSFGEADASDANFVRATLDHVSFRDANLGAARFIDASMILVELCGANLAHALMARAILDRADFTGAKGLDPEQLAMVYIHGAKGLSEDVVRATLANLAKSLDHEGLAARVTALESVDADTPPCNG